MCSLNRLHAGVRLAVTFAALAVIPLCQPGAAIAAELRYPSEADLIEVVFDRDAVVRLRGGAPADLGESKGLTGVDQVLAKVAWTRWTRICETPEAAIDEATAQGEANIGKPLHSPNNMYRLQISPGIDPWEISRELEALPGVYSARPVPKPMALPTPGDYIAQQGYLRPASSIPAGIDADAAWVWPGGTGAGVTVCDLEYSWNYAHADVNWGGEAHTYTQDPQNNDNHGTAVLGVLGSRDNGWGTKGICYGATIRTCGTYFKPPGGTTYSWNVPGSIADAAFTGMQAGDVILIEHQWDLPGRGLVPIEWWTCTTTTQFANAAYLNIQWAIATKRMHVVEPAGNGNVDLNTLTWAGDSGAIIVGAGGAYPGGTWADGNLQRLSFSSYGTRVDLQGWGENVVTTGYSDLYSAEGKDYWYTSAFDGTSSASPIIAAAIANCESCWRTNLCSRFPLDNAHIRNVLKATGTPQITPPAGNIGPRPNLPAAFARLYEWRDATIAPLDSGDYPPAWGDYDNDGDLDLYLPYNRPYANRLLQNNGNGVFTDVTPDLLKLSGNDSYSAAWGDYDNDGDLDLYVSNYGTGQCKLFRNDGGSWSDATSGPLSGWPAGVTPVPTWVDYDNDGDIDLYLANYGGANALLRNNGDGSFTNVTSGPEGDAGNTTHAAWADYDNDGDQDVYIVNANSSNRLLRNDGGVFVDVTPGNLATYEGGNAWWGDYDNDGDLDMYLVIANYGYSNKLFRNDGGSFVDVTPGILSGVEHDVNAGWIDADNDGDLDLYLVSSPEGNHLYKNDGSGVFTEETHTLLAWQGYMTTFSWGDCDNDGDIDPYFVVSSPANSNTLVRNGSTGSNRWLQVRLRGVSSNRCGIGARIRVVTGTKAQIQEVRANAYEHTLIATFGVGPATTVDSLQVFWPSGTLQDSLNVATNQRVVIYEGMEASGVDGEGVPPRRTLLRPGAPNPFTTTAPMLVRYDIARTSPVDLTIHDVSGRMVRALVRAGSQRPGSYSVTWDGRDDTGRLLPSGVYFGRLRARDYSGDRRLVLIR